MANAMIVMSTTMPNTKTSACYPLRVQQMVSTTNFISNLRKTIIFEMTIGRSNVMFSITCDDEDEHSKKDYRNFDNVCFGTLQ